MFSLNNISSLKIIYPLPEFFDPFCRFNSNGSSYLFPLIKIVSLILFSFPLFVTLFYLLPVFYFLLCRLGLHTCRHYRCGVLSCMVCAGVLCTVLQQIGDTGNGVCMSVVRSTLTDVPSIPLFGPVVISPVWDASSVSVVCPSVEMVMMLSSMGSCDGMVGSVRLGPAHPVGGCR